jgi:CheY-like chemotaxis protein
MGEGIETRVVSQSGRAFVMVDPTQISQIIMSLAVNARDARPTGGQLTFFVETPVLDEAFCAERGLTPGPHVLLTVSDDGEGIPPHLREKIFEPFYTTKAKGHGTGLGLSMVYASIKHSGGHIDLESVPGSGTTFSIYLPLVEATGSQDDAERLPSASYAPGRLVLLVEDDEELRPILGQTITGAGYRVTACADAEVALASWHAGGAPDIVVADLTLPAMNGLALCETLSKTFPKVPRVLMSGYPDGELARRGIDVEGIEVLRKPFSPAQLLDAIGRNLRGPA